MALVTVRRAAGSAGGPAEENVPRRRQLQRRQSFVMVKGAALLLPAEEPLEAEPPPAAPPGQAPGQQEQHLQLMMQLLRPQDAIRLAVRLESARPRRVRYLLVVRPEEAGAEGETALLGVDFTHEGATCCTLGMVLPLWSDTQVFLDGDGGFSVTSGGQTRIFKPISVQTMWAVLQELHRACEEASRGGHIPGGPALAWARGYAAALASEQSCLNEWLAMADLESVRPASPTPLRPAAPELSEQAVRALLRDVMASADLESVTSKEVREELERRTGHSLARHKDFIDNEMLLVLAQMDRPSRVFPHLYLGSEWNAANLEELQQNRVTHILNVAREIDNFFPALFTYMNVRVYDEETAQLLPHWNDTFLFLSQVRAGGGRALVHCRMGLSRSAATVLAYTMKEFGWPLERALRHVRHCRPGVLPNPGFMRQLDFYQGILQASRHSSLWEPKAAAAAGEQAAQPEEGPEVTAGGEGGLSPAPAPQSPEETGGPGLLGASRRPRISLCAVMRSISLLECPEPPELPAEPLGGEVTSALDGIPGVEDVEEKPRLQLHDAAGGWEQAGALWSRGAEDEGQTNSVALSGEQGPRGLLHQPADSLLPGRGGLAGAAGGHQGGGLDPGLPDPRDAGGAVPGRARGGRRQGAAGGDVSVPGAAEPPAPPTPCAGATRTAPGTRVPVPHPAAQRHVGFRGQHPQPPVPAEGGAGTAQRLPAGTPRAPRFLEPLGPPGHPQPRLHVARLAGTGPERGDVGCPGPGVARPWFSHLLRGAAPQHPLATSRPRRRLPAPARNLLHPGSHPPHPVVPGEGDTGGGHGHPEWGTGGLGGVREAVVVGGIKWGYLCLRGGSCHSLTPTLSSESRAAPPFTLAPTDGTSGSLGPPPCGAGGAGALEKGFYSFIQE
ncbi:protein phosphatase Slingshot homolog 3 isoform X2 [Strix aluco]|uniref:protein phosphatase Slingshot homolog 3 isoform X2 n=1 Tax=Strix aluco TaxID=111821 RepID=UPI003DA24F31